MVVFVSSHTPLMLLCFSLIMGKRGNEKRLNFSKPKLQMKIFSILLFLN